MPPELILQYPFPELISPLQEELLSISSENIIPGLPDEQVIPKGACGGYRHGEQLPQQTKGIVISEVPTVKVLFVYTGSPLVQEALGSFIS